MYDTNTEEAWAGGGVNVNARMAPEPAADRAAWAPQRGSPAPLTPEAGCPQPPLRAAVPIHLGLSSLSLMHARAPACSVRCGGGVPRPPRPRRHAPPWPRPVPNLLVTTTHAAAVHGTSTT